MNARLVKIFLLSVFLHVAVFLLLVHRGLFESGLSRNVHSSEPLSAVLAVTLKTGKKEPEQIASPLHDKETIALGPEKSTPPEISVDPVPVVEPESNPAYAPAGLLTRRPSPIGEINLDVTAIDEVAVGGKIELTVFVNKDGTVADVSTIVEDDHARIFADRVAARIWPIRFTPGEIDGKPVRAEWRITVVSEPRQMPETK